MKIDWPTLAVNTRKPRTPKIPYATEYLRDGQWKNQPVWILGGGPSLGPIIESGRIREISQWPRIAVNESWRVEPFAPIAVAKDYRFLDHAENNELWKSIDQVRVTDEVHAARRNWTRTAWLRQLDYRQWPKSLEDGWNSIGNSGVAAVCLADLLGASLIVLLGIDGRRNDDGQYSWHESYPKDWLPTDSIFSRFSIHFRNVASMIRARVINANPESAINVFPKMTFEQALEEAKKYG